MKKTVFTVLIVTAIFTVLILSGCGGSKTDGKRVRQSYITAMTDIQTLAAAVESYFTDNDTFPEADSAGKLSPFLVPMHIKRMPVKDPWGNEYLYKVEGNTFFIASPGSDGVFNGYDQTGQFSTYEGQDIIFGNGKFQMFPK